MYAKIIGELEGTPELYHELSLYNKVGDLHLKVGSVQDAVDMYERAVDRYAESGLPNNAIALCNKILRNAPGRTQVYLKLAQLMVERGFVAEAKQNLLEYAERMQRAGRLEEAFEALKDFADLSPANEEIRLLLAEQLKAAARTEEAREQLDKLYAELQAAGDERRSRVTLEKIRVIDPDFEMESAPVVPTKVKPGKQNELVFLDLEEGESKDDVATGTEDVAPASPDDLFEIQRTPFEEEQEADLPAASDLEVEATALGEDIEAGVDALAGLDIGRWEEPEVGDVARLEIEPTALEEPEEWKDLEEKDAELLATDEDEDGELPLIAVEAADDSGGDEVELPMLEVPEEDEEWEDSEVASAAAALELDVDEGAGVEVPELDLEGFEPEAEKPAPAATGISALEERVADDPDNPVFHRELGEALIEAGERQRGLEELNLALRTHEAREEWQQGEALNDELLRLEPNSTRHHQKRVEYAFRRGEKGRLVDAYLGLADALVRTDEVERGRLVYHRVLEHDPDNESARGSLAALEPERVAPAAKPAPPVEKETGGEDFVDLTALVMGDEPTRARDTRMRIEEEEPTGDEQRDFERMLSRFKRGIEANLGEEDAQAHYDLGVAFKEMGLLDEAISEFQKALRAADGRLRTAETLGRCFFEKGQFSVGATVLRRAIDSEAGGDDTKIGLLYWLGRCEEEQAKSAEALVHYQRVFAVDIGFEDVRARVRSLAKAGS